MPRPLPGPLPGPPSGTAPLRAGSGSVGGSHSAGIEAGKTPDPAPEVSTALRQLAEDLPHLALAEHHDRYAAVLEQLHTVLADAVS